MYKHKKVNIISSIRTSKLVEQCFLAYLAHFFWDVKIEAPSFGSIQRGSNFVMFFQMICLTCLGKKHRFLCLIRANTRPISIPPYRMALVELRDLKALSKSFLIRFLFVQLFPHAVLHFCLLRRRMVA